ncbi:MAG: hypothetical protein NT049_14920 [Planctomycetota bacterium]|nr:hypothetical protein [Planctomycetota bacterium]
MPFSHTTRPSSLPKWPEIVISAGAVMMRARYVGPVVPGVRSWTTPSVYGFWDHFMPPAGLVKSTPLSGAKAVANPSPFLAANGPTSYHGPSFGACAASAC